MLDTIYYTSKRCFKSIYRSIKYFFQRKIYGCDYSELWCGLDISFLKWLYKKLNFLYQILGLELYKQYPNNYNSLEEWKEDIRDQLKNIEYILCDEPLTNNESLYKDVLKKKVIQWFANNAGNLWI